MKVWLISDVKKDCHRKIIRMMFHGLNLSRTRIGLEYEVGYVRGYFLGIAGEGIISNWAFERYYDFFNKIIAKKRMELMHEEI